MRAGREERGQGEKEGVCDDKEEGRERLDEGRKQIWLKIYHKKVFFLRLLL